MHGLAVHGLHLFHVSSPSLFYYSSFIQAYVDHGRIGLHLGWDWCLSSFIMIPPQTRTFDDSKYQMTRAGSQKILIFDLQTTQRKSDTADSALLSLQ